MPLAKFLSEPLLFFVGPKNWGSERQQQQQKPGEVTASSSMGNKEGRFMGRDVDAW